MVPDELIVFITEVNECPPLAYLLACLYPMPPGAVPPGIMAINGMSIFN